MPFTFKDWYDKNRERLSEARKARYESDPSYREKVQKQNRDARCRKQKDEAKEKRQETKAKRVDVGDPWKQLEIDGQTFLTIGALSRVLGKSVKTLRLWETKGILPKTEHRSPRGDRLYLPEQVLQIREALIQAGKVSDAGPQERLVAKSYKVRIGNGEKDIPLFRVAVLAKTAGRSVATILQLEDKGRFPQTPLRSSGGQRLYSVEMIEAAREALARFDKTPGRDWESFYSWVFQSWTALGIFDATVLK